MGQAKFVGELGGCGVHCVVSCRWHGIDSDDIELVLHTRKKEKSVARRDYVGSKRI